MENDIDLITKLVDGLQKVNEHLLDQNAQLINLLVSMNMPQAPVNMEPEEVQSDVALDGGSND